MLLGAGGLFWLGGIFAHLDRNWRSEAVTGSRFRPRGGLRCPPDATATGHRSRRPGPSASRGRPFGLVVSRRGSSRLEQRLEVADDPGPAAATARPGLVGAVMTAARVRRVGDVVGDGQPVTPSLLGGSRR